MTIVWLIIVMLFVYYVVVAFGSVLLRFFVAVAVVVSTPVREIIRLYKSNQKKESTCFAGQFFFRHPLIRSPYMVARRYIVSIEILRRYQAAKGWKQVNHTMNNQQPTTPKSPRPLTGCGCLTLAAGIGFSVSILFIEGYPSSDRLFSCLVSLFATWTLVRVISFIQRLFRDE